MAEYILSQNNIDYNVIEATIRMPRQGRWIIEARIDSDTVPTAAAGPITLTGGGMTLVGTVVDERSGTFALKTLVYIVAGLDGILLPITSRDYNNPTVRQLVNDICSAVGEVLASDSDSTILGQTLARWSYNDGPATNILTSIIKSLESLDAVWRFKPNGDLLITQETWPTVNIPDSGDGAPHIMDEMFTNIKREFWIETIDLDTIRPGVVWNDKRISIVEISIHQSQTRVTTWFETTASKIGRFQDPWNNIIAAVQKRTQYNILYAGYVVTYHSDDATIDFQPDAQAVPGMSRVAILAPSPGFQTVPSSNARCVVSFTDNDPQKPICIWFESDASKFNNIKLGDPSTAQPMVLGQDLKNYIDNQIKIQFNQLRTDFISHTHPYVNVSSPATTSPPVPGTTSAPLPNSPALSTKIFNS